MNSNRVKSVKEEWDAAVKKSLTSISQEQIKEKFLGEGLTNYYVKIIRKLNPEKKSLWLDVCCGSGSNSLALATNHSCYTVAFDISYERLKVGQKIIKNYTNSQHIDFINADLFHLPFKEKKFDGIIATQSFSPYDINEQKESLSELLSLLREGGIFFLSDYNKGPKIYHLLGSSKYREILKEIGFSVLEIQEWGHTMYAILSRFRYKVLRRILLKTSNKYLHKFYIIFTRFIFKVGDLENKIIHKNGVLFYIIAKK